MQLRTESGYLIPLTGTAKVILTLYFKKLDYMEAYYQQQAVPPNFCRVIAVKEVEVLAF